MSRPDPIAPTPGWLVPTDLLGVLQFAAIAFAVMTTPPANDAWRRR